MKKYWYVTIVWHCPVCGKEDKRRHRVYEKPKESIVWKTDYDYCDVMPL